MVFLKVMLDLLKVSFFDTWLEYDKKIKLTNHSLSYMLKIAYENNFNASLYTGFSKINEYFLVSLLAGASYDKKFIKNKEDKISLKIYQQLIKNTALSFEYQKILKSSEEFKIGISYYF